MSGLALQRLVLPAATETAGLYWRHAGTTQHRLAATGIRPGAALDLDTYFNSFDESTWRAHTTLGELAVEVELTGTGHVQLWRHGRNAPPALLSERSASGRVRVEVPTPPHPRGAGRLALRILNDADPASADTNATVELVGGAWVTDATPQDIALMPVLCTFNRDAALADLIERLAADAPVVAACAGIVIVNNGMPLLSERIGAGNLPPALTAKLHIVEQANFGGAGGFTRGMIEAKGRGATHVILMDDDVAIEPEAVLRTVRFYSLARHPLAIAGHMLDLFRPTHLYEAGAQLDDRLALRPVHLGAELSHPGALDRFLEPTPLHYNGWWFMGLPLSLADQLGLPMPFFIRCDDVEYGYRLHDAGVPLVAMAGIGIWHEPFYAKLDSWHVYYEMRNLFVLAACHKPHALALITRIAARSLVAELLMFRYYRVAMILRAIEDFLAGPAILQRNPAELHAGLAAVRRAYPSETVRRERVLPGIVPAIGPRTRLRFALGVCRAMVDEFVRPDSDARTIIIEPRDHLWFRVRRADAVVVREPWETELPVHRRRRATYRALLRRSLVLLRRLRNASVLVQDWHDAKAELASPAQWRRYLGMPAAREAVPVREPASAET